MDMQTANATRVARHRERRREGLVVVPTEIDEIATTEFLINAQVLQPCDRDDRVEVGRALGRLVEKIVKEQL